MIDFRNTYRAVPVKNEEDFWRVEFRRWFSPFWKTIRYRTGLDNAKEIAVKHAAGDIRKTIHFGRLPA